jgi:hypothetical protein
MRARHRLGAIAVLAAAAFLFVGAAQTSGGTLVVSSNTTLTEDHYGNIVIAADHVTLNGAGHRVIGIGTGTGVLVDGHIGVTLANLDVSGFEVGIALVNPAHHAPGVDATMRGSTLSRQRPRSRAGRD